MGTRLAALLTLAALGGPSLAVEAPAGLGPRTSWSTALAAEAPDLRRRAAQALGRLPRLTEAESAALLRALDDAEPRVRLEAAIGLAGRGPSARIVGLLVVAEPTPAVVAALAREATGTPAASDALVVLLGQRSEAEEVWQWGLPGLVPRARLDARIPPLLLRGVNHPSHRVRRVAVGGLGALLDRPEVRAALTKPTAEDPHPDVRAAACDAWAQATDPTWLPKATLLRAALDPVASVRSAALAALDPLRHEIDVDDLVRQAFQTDQDPTVRAVAERILGRATAADLPPRKGF